MLKVKNINVNYGIVRALQDVSMTVESGEVVSLVGSNGAGKTTLLKTISGIIFPLSGSIEFLGQPIEGIRAHHLVKRGIVHIPEGRGLFPELTIEENLVIGAYSISSREAKKETEQLVFNIFPVLQERRKQLAGTLSGGEQQMLAIARGMMSSPKLMMLDEPSLGLAPKLISRLFHTIQSLNQKGITILLVEQNIRYSLILSKRGYVLENGRIRTQGKSKDLLNSDDIKKAYLGL